MTELTLIKTNLKRYTFESPKIKKWVENNSSGKVLNLFAGKTNLNLDEVRNENFSQVFPELSVLMKDYTPKPDWRFIPTGTYPTE